MTPPDESRCPSCGISEVRPDGSRCTQCGTPVTKTKPTGDDPATLVRSNSPKPRVTQARPAARREGSRPVPAPACEATATSLETGAALIGAATDEESIDMTDDSYTACGKPRADIPTAEWHTIPGEADTCMKYANHRVTEGKMKTFHRGRLSLLSADERDEKVAKNASRKADRELEAAQGKVTKTSTRKSRVVTADEPDDEPDDNTAPQSLHPQRAVLTPAHRNGREMGSGPVASPITRPEAADLGSEDDESEGEDA